jgi:glycosyltransferase involved in cell wall biosynthesis
MSTSASLYFFAGDFADVLKRYEDGVDHIYATHDEVAKLIEDLLAAGVRLTVYSFITPKAREDTPRHGLRIVSLGARNFAEVDLLSAAVARDESDAIVAHFAPAQLLRAVIARGRRSMAVLANSYNGRGLRAGLERRRISSLLNNPRFELVSNHCMPATQHLAALGVMRNKLIAWDVPHRFDPNDVEPKSLPQGRPSKAAYAGTINEDKGVGDLIRAVAALREQDVELECSLAGGGDIDAMIALAAQLGVRDLVTFRGLVPNRDVFAMFRDADVVVVPSRSGYPEGFPLTMFEAIASRTPIVCSDHPMFRSVMKDGIHAAMFRAGSSGAFADAIRKVVTDADLYWRLSGNAQLSWAALKGPADWRTMLREWILNGSESQWIREHKLDGSSRAAA